MASKGKATLIINDFKPAFVANKLIQEAKKLDKFLKYLGKYDQEKLVSDLKAIGYDINADYLTRPTQVEEIMFNKSSEVIDIFDQYHYQIKTNNQWSESEKEGAGCFLALLVVLGVFVGFVTLLSGVFTNGGKDGLVVTDNSYPNADTDTTTQGTLSLKSTADKEFTSRSNPKLLTTKLVIITPTPSKGKVRLIFKESEAKPYEIVQYETKGITNDAHTSLDIPLTVKEIKWEIDR
jgi:hypothetical protein